MKLAVIVGAALIVGQGTPPQALLDRLEPLARKTVEAQLAEQPLEAKVLPALERRDMALKNILETIAREAGVTLRYDPALAGLGQPADAKLDSMTVDQALKAVTQAHGLAFRALGRASAVVFANTPAKHAEFTPVVRAFVLAKADLSMATTRLNRLMTSDAIGLRPMVVTGDRESRAMFVRAIPAQMAEVARLIAEIDK